MDDRILIEQALTICGVMRDRLVAAWKRRNEDGMGTVEVVVLVGFLLAAALGVGALIKQVVDRYSAKIR